VEEENTTRLFLSIKIATVFNKNLIELIFTLKLRACLNMPVTELKNKMYPFDRMVRAGQINSCQKCWRVVISLFSFLGSCCCCCCLSWVDCHSSQGQLND
jgi:hypothetical protein